MSYNPTAVSLPCHFGDDIYIIIEENGKYIARTHKVLSFTITENDIFVNVEKNGVCDSFIAHKECFFSKEEARESLTDGSELVFPDERSDELIALAERFAAEVEELIARLEKTEAGEEEEREGDIEWLERLLLVAGKATSEAMIQQSFGFVESIRGKYGI